MSSTALSTAATSSSKSRAGTRNKGRWFNVRIVVRVPGHELIVNRDHDEDVYVALRDAFASLTRRLEDVARRQHGEVKTHGSQA